ncbi:MAG: hypothetical protein K5696_02670 [Lachnospiraceae bacterium]|nr:hypothetical protein [Lachnospiraceae bacterium]
MELGGINAGAYADYMNQQTQNAAGDKLKSVLESAAKNAKNARTDADGEVINEELMNACNQFESYFLEQVFKEMQKSVDALKQDESGSNKQLVDFFKERTLQDLTAKSTETQGLGFAQMLYENMKHTVGMSAADIEAHNAAIIAAADGRTDSSESEDGDGESAEDGSSAGAQTADT